MFDRYSRLAILAIAAALLSACTCYPPIDDSAAQVVALCGDPDAAAPSSLTSTHEEWRYGDVYVGLMNGEVTYVLR